MGDSPLPPNPTEPVSKNAPAAPVLLRLAGWLGVMGAVLGLVIFLLGCAGIGLFRFSYLPTGLGAASLFFVLVSGLLEKRRAPEASHVLAAIFTGLIGLVGGLCEMAVWLNWQTFAR